MASTANRKASHEPPGPTTSDALLDAVSAGVRLVELGQPFFTGMPCSPNHPGFRMTLIRRHGDMVRPDGGSAANEIIVTGGHVGTHVDALSHVSHDGLMYGGVDAAQSQVGGSFRELGAEHTPAFLCRGVLLDVAATLGVPVLAPGQGVGAVELQAALDRCGTDLRPGDVALVRTGWAQHFDDAERYLSKAEGVPGVTPDGGRWLADAGVSVAGQRHHGVRADPPRRGAQRAARPPHPAGAERDSHHRTPGP